VNRLFQWAFSIWLVSATVRYTSTIWKTVNELFNTGNGLPSFNGWICACGTLFVAAVLYVPVLELQVGACQNP
jgi:hypothetical protein